MDDQVEVQEEDVEHIQEGLVTHLQLVQLKVVMVVIHHHLMLIHTVELEEVEQLLWERTQPEQQ